MTEALLLSANLGIDLVLKLVLLAFVIYLFHLLRRFDHALRRAEQSIDSVEEAADEAAELARLGRKIPFLGGSR